MAIKYKVSKKRNGINNKEAYHAHSWTTGKVGIYEIADTASKAGALCRGDMIAAYYGMLRAIKLYLSMGYHVDLEELAILSVAISSEGTDTPEKLTPGKVKANGLNIKVSTEMKRFLETIDFEAL